jgi:uncharacterized protein YbaR (Trm112 family)
MIDPELLAILACPACRGEIIYLEAREVLKCAQCRRVYRIDDGIPVMLIEEATFDPDEAPPQPAATNPEGAS